MLRDPLSLVCVKDKQTLGELAREMIDLSF